MSPGRRQHRITITVTLSYHGRTESADEESSDTPAEPGGGGGQAAVTVLDRLLSDSSLALEGAKIVEGSTGDVRLRGGPGAGRAGHAPPERHGGDQESPERAAVFAVLDATNRWTEARQVTT